jgi:multidrug efflux pump subunit AcrB
MWIVRLALHRPYTVAILCMTILLMGILSIFSMAVDIFPEVDIPVVIVVWNYTGLSAEDMERRVVIISERSMSTSVSGITHIESTSMSGTGIERVYFEPDADIGGAIAQITSSSLTALRTMPPGMQPPVILRFNATNVQVAQMTVSGNGPSESELFDYGLNFIRIKLFTVPGLATPAPFGGKQRQVQIDIDEARCAAKGISPQDVVNTLLNQNVILPSGDARMGNLDYDVILNSSPQQVLDFNAIPIRQVNGKIVYLGDVANAYDGYAVQSNIVRVNGKRATYLSILKKENSSTLAVVDAAKEMLPTLQAAAPSGFELKIAFDQSVFVRGAVTGVLREAGISAGLVAIMTLAFIGSWRSTVIVCISIPLSIMVGVIGLKLTGQTLNLMTLGGLSLAIGMLVDDATVEVENINRNRSLGKNVVKAILDGARQIATPAMAATLTICIVFFPVVMLTGPSKFLFFPLAIAVVFSMLASYLLSRTLVPTLAHMLLAHEKPDKPENAGSVDEMGGGQKEEAHQEDLDFHDHPQQLDFDLPAPVEEGKKNWREKLNEKREHAFEKLQDGYTHLLMIVIARRKTVVAFAGLVIAVSLGLVLAVGLDFFPSVDSGIMKLHYRAAPGTRIEQTEREVDQVERNIRQIIPEDELSTINDNIGVPLYYNLGYIQTDSANGSDAEILIALGDKHEPAVEYQEKIRAMVQREFPAAVAYFQSADIVTQVLNFGASSPIDLQVEGQDWTKTFPIALKLEGEMKKIPGAADVHVVQQINHPTLHVDVDRARAALVGLTERDVASSLLTSLSSSTLVSPNQWVNPSNNVNYTVAVQTPISQIDGTNSILQTPITPGTTPIGPSLETELQDPTSIAPSALPTTTNNGTSTDPPLLGQIAQIHPSVDRSIINHYSVQPVIEVQASVEKRDLGSVASEIEKAVKQLGPLPTGVTVHLRGQSETMYSSFKALGLGLIVAIALVYFLMVVLFQSWVDPFIIMMAIPGAFSGILWMLVLTGTTLNVESLMGSIMAVGIAVSNSILLVTFANESRGDGDEEENESEKQGEPMGSVQAALLAGRTRLRPVIMTALAMLLGMLPMAFGLGDGGEQNAPLGRAVIGGILAATMMTLFVVPCVYAIARQKPPRKRELTARIEDSDNDMSDEELARKASGDTGSEGGEGHEGNEVHA